MAEDDAGIRDAAKQLGNWYEHTLASRKRG